MFTLTGYIIFVILEGFIGFSEKKETTQDINTLKNGVLDFLHKLFICTFNACIHKMCSLNVISHAVYSSSVAI